MLDRHGRRVPRVHLDDPPEPVDLVGGGDDVETRVEALPQAFRRAALEAVACQSLGGDGVGDVLGVGEVLVEVLLAGEHRAPRGETAGAVVQGAEHAGAGRVGGGLDQVAARGGTGENELGQTGDTPVVRAEFGCETTGSGLTLDLHDGQPVIGPSDAHLLLGGVVGIVAGEHEGLGRVLVVDHQQVGVRHAVDGQQPREVVVVAELLLLRGRGLVADVEGGRIRQHRVTPPDDDGLVVALGNGHDVVGVRDDGGEVGAGGRGAEVRRARRRGAAGAARVVGTRGEHTARTDREHRHRAAAQHAAPAHGGAHDVTEVLAPGGVGHGVGTRVAALVAAGDGGA